MNNPFIRISLASVAALLLVWTGAALLLKSKTASAQKEYQEKSLLAGRYESLKKVWSKKSQKYAQKKLKTLLRLYSIRPEIRKKRHEKIYTFQVDRRNADAVLGKLLNSGLALSSFRVEKIDAGHLRVRVGVPL
ncbi:hypothetical protein [Hydrogenimonas urashimensis]|uniref:hypothetical protein n=1 Tax=Hydrogenimonas urashimensis TaxID=2740515 RepID=UPI001915F3F9|nr:hypothetical protein [Hydrogenimonas urashimensis]